MALAESPLHCFSVRFRPISVPKDTKLLCYLVSGMVTHLNIPLDDTVADRVRTVKDAQGLTWAEFLTEAADALEDGGSTNDVSEVGAQPTNLDKSSSELIDSAPDEFESELESVESVSELAVDDLDLPGSGDKLERRQAAVQRLYDYLRENGTAKKSNFLQLIDADQVGYSSAESFWSNCIKGRESLGSLSGVVSPSEGEHTWRFEG